jgi:hypothetical protein
MLIDTARDIIYDRHMFTVQATGLIARSKLKMEIKLMECKLDNHETGAMTIGLLYNLAIQHRCYLKL